MKFIITSSLLTLDLEIDNKLNYVDLTIIRTNDGLEFDVFKKPKLIVLYHFTQCNEETLDGYAT